MLIFVKSRFLRPILRQIRNWHFVDLTPSFIAAFLLVVFAPAVAPAAAPAAAPAEDKPPARFSLIFAERFRFEAWDNAINLANDSGEGFAYTRNKTTFGFDWRPWTRLEVLAKATNELRVYVLPKDRVFTWHEIFFDNLYVRWRPSARRPFTLTVGRQDIFLGEGFVVADGTPLDGSRSYYFNAVRFDYDIRPNHRLTAFLHTMDRTDRFLPVIHAPNLLTPQALVEQPERAVMIYYAGRFGRVGLDGYFIRKSVTAPEAGMIPSGINTLGARTVAVLVPPLALTLEGAWQSGSCGGVKRAAFGGIAHLDYSPRWRFKTLKTFVLGGIYLTGDDPATPRMEGWDPLFSRWPKWSEGYIYTLSRESRIAYWSNLSSVYGSLVFDFGPSANATVTVHRLGAEHARPGEFPGGTGLRRGALIVGRLNFVINKALSGHLEWDRFDPGDFYRPGAAGFNWLRLELQVKY